MSFEQWLDQVEPLSCPADRLTLAQTFKKTKLLPEEWLPTIELLRSALVLNTEQVTYCFSQLPRTQKNKALRECFLFYLDSPLCQDRMGQIWSLMERLKSPDKDKPNLLPTDFIPSEPSAYLFQEFVKVAAARYSGIQLRPFFEMGTLRSKDRPRVILGTPASTLNALCDAVGTYANNYPGQNILISFKGTDQSKAFLRNRLASFGLLTAEFDAKTNTHRAYWSEMLVGIRRKDCLTPEQKFSLNSALLAHPPFEGELLESYKARLLSHKVITEEDFAKIGALSMEEAPKSPPPPCRVLITPFCHLPNFDGATEFSFVDESLLEPVLNETLLSESELETLFFAGFQMPRWSERMRGRLNVLKEKACSLEDRVYSALSPEHLEGFSLITPHASSIPLSPVRHSHRAPLPVSTLSATQLETYAECPSKYLYRRFKLHRVSLPMNEFALHLGQSVHLTLETLFSATERPALSPQLLRSTFMTSLSATLPSLSTQENLSLFFLKAFEKMIPRILFMEQSLSALFGAQSTVAVEKEFKIEVDGVSVVGKIDRVDLLPDQRILVLDYKTGNVDFTPDHLSKGYNFQALLYWLGSEQSLGMAPAAMLFYDLKKGEIKRGLALEEAISLEAKKHLTRGHTLSAEKLEALLQSGKAVMQTFATAIRSGNFSPTPSPEACRFCEAVGFCREGAGYA